MAVMAMLDTSCVWVGSYVGNVLSFWLGGWLVNAVRMVFLRQCAPDDKGWSQAAWGAGELGVWWRAGVVSGEAEAVRTLTAVAEHGHAGAQCCHVSWWSAPTLRHLSSPKFLMLLASSKVFDFNILGGTCVRSLSIEAIELPPCTCRCPALAGAEQASTG